MLKNGGLWTRSPAGRAGQEEAVRLLDNSQRLLSAILLAVLMQMRSLELERQELLGAPGQGAEQLQLWASLLSVWALAGFQRQSRELSDPCDGTLASTSLAIGLIRLIKLLCPGQESEFQEAEILDITSP